MIHGFWAFIGQAVTIVGVLASAGLGLLAVVAGLIVLWRRRRRGPVRSSSTLPPGWRVIPGGKAGPRGTDPSPPLRHPSSGE